MMEKENKKQNIIIVILSIVFVLLLTLCIYLAFIKKDESPTNIQNIDNNIDIDNDNDNDINNPNDLIEKTFTRLEKIELTENNKTVTINGKTVQIRAKDDYLYVNNKQIMDSYFLAKQNDKYYVYISDYLIYVFGVAQDLDTLQLILDENGNEIDILNNQYVALLYLEDGKIIGRNASYDLENGSIYEDYYELVYNGENVVYKKVN